LQTLPGVEIVTEDYVCTLHGVAEEINYRFSDLRALKPSFAFLEKPFLVDFMKNGCPMSQPIAVDSAAVELELLELQEDEALKRVKQSGCSTTEFRKQVPEQKYPKIKACAQRLISIFSTTYSCESLYSALKSIKSKYRSVLSDEHLNELMRTALTSHQPIFKQLTAKMDTRKASTSKSNM
jgi:17beta-estradiol 17-dehydrogenase/3beta-hydroxysteroid 3-dehydrogenase/mitotic-spindle organizing protein 1